MKKLTLLFFLLFSFAAMVSQNWCPPGAMWQYKSYSTLRGVDATLEFNCSGDTVMNGKNCKRIDALLMGSVFYVTYTVVPYYVTLYTHESNGLLLVANGAVFDTVVNFQAKPGDTWYLKPSACSYPNRWEVKDTTSVLINGHKLRKIVAATLPAGPWNGDSVTVELIERICPFFMVTEFDFLRGPCYDGSAEFVYTNFVCYKDDEFGAYSPSGAGCNRQVGLDDFRLKSINVYCDLEAGNLYAEVPGSGYTLVVSDLYGKEVMKTALVPGRNTVSCREWAAGVYVCRVFQGSAGVYSSKFIMQ